VGRTAAVTGIGALAGALALIAEYEALPAQERNYRSDM
jgi:hypothetical protein